MITVMPVTAIEFATYPDSDEPALSSLVKLRRPQCDGHQTGGDAFASCAGLNPPIVVQTTGNAKARARTTATNTRSGFRERVRGPRPEAVDDWATAVTVNPSRAG